MFARFVAYYVMPPCGLKIPNPAHALTFDEQMDMLRAAIDKAPAEKKTAADYSISLF
jgi:hypothetical protein